MRERQNIWLIMGGIMLIVTLVIIIMQGCVFSAMILKMRQGDVLTLISELTTIVAKSTLTPTLLPTFTPTLGSQPSTSTPTPTEAIPTLTSTPSSTSMPTLLPTLTLTLGSQPSTSTPTPTETVPTSTSTPPPTSTPTPLPTVIPTLTKSPTPSPADVAWQQVAPFDQQAQEFDEETEQMTPEQLGPGECPYVSSGPGECWIYRIGVGNMILVEGYAYVANLYAYDFYGDGQPEILKWDLGRDGQFDVIEYDVDGDEVFDYATADMNSNGQFDYEEIYMYEDATESWQPLVPGALPFPILPVFLY